MITMFKISEWKGSSDNPLWYTAAMTLPKAKEIADEKRVNQRGDVKIEDVKTGIIYVQRYRNAPWDSAAKRPSTKNMAVMAA